MDKNIPLSELIRIGSKVSGQCHRWIRDRNGNTCALGAALTAKYGALPRQGYDTAVAMTDLQISDKVVTHPIIGEKCNLGITVTMLNDYEGWTREQIADWLEGEGL